MVSILAVDASPVMSANELLSTRAAELQAFKYDGGSADAPRRRPPPSCRYDGGVLTGGREAPFRYQRKGLLGRV